MKFDKVLKLRNQTAITFLVGSKLYKLNSYTRGRIRIKGIINYKMIDVTFDSATVPLLLIGFGTKVAYDVFNLTNLYCCACKRTVSCMQFKTVMNMNKSWIGIPDS
jgi:hypothetical protein